MTKVPKERKRRQYGTGSITQRKSDGLWVGRMEAGYYANGKRRRLVVYGKSETEAKQKLDAKRRQVAREGTPDEQVSARATVKAWSDEWLETSVQKLRPKSYATTSSAVRKWIVPTIGRKRLELLTPKDIRAVADAQRKAGLSSSTARRTHSVLMAMLKSAILEGHQVPQRVLLVEAPAKSVSDRDALPVEAAVAMLEVASRPGWMPHGSRWATAFLQGMRQGECLGLTWPEVDFEQRLLRVSWQLQSLPYIDKSDRSKGFRVPDGYEARHLVDAYHLVRPKSESGWRVIPLIPWIHDALLAWRQIAPPNEFDLVWPNAAGRPVNADYDVEEWQALQCTAGVGHPAGRYYVTHEARHTTATLLLEANIDPMVITAIMGHSSIMTSRLYMHTNQTMATQALQQIATRLQLTVAGS